MKKIIKFNLVLFALLSVSIISATSDAATTCDRSSSDQKNSRPATSVAADMARSEQQNNALAQKEALLAIEKNFLAAAAAGKPLWGFLATKDLNINVQDADGKTALMLAVIRYSQISQQDEKKSLLGIITDLLAKNAWPFGIRDHSKPNPKNAWDYAEDDKDLQSLMMRMQSKDWQRRGSVDQVMSLVHEIYPPAEGKKEEE